MSTQKKRTHTLFIRNPLSITAVMPRFTPFHSIGTFQTTQLVYVMCYIICCEAVPVHRTPATAGVGQHQTQSDSSTTGSGDTLVNTATSLVAGHSWPGATKDLPGRHSTGNGNPGRGSMRRIGNGKNVNGCCWCGLGIDKCYQANPEPTTNAITNANANDHPNLYLYPNSSRLTPTVTRTQCQL